MYNENVDCEDNIDYKIDKWYTEEEKSVFAKIDFNQENKDVDMFQKNGDTQLFEKVYRIRIPTLQIWARKYSYLVDSKEDMFGEFGLAFTKAVFTYQKSKGYFNTYLFRLLINCTQNLMISRRAKKRLPEGMDPKTITKFMLSLDYSYDNKDGSGNTLKDVISDKMLVEPNTIDKMIADETINLISGKNSFIHGFFKRLSDGNTVASLIKEFKIRRGNIKISQEQVKRLKEKRRQKRAVIALIKDNNAICGDFLLVDYSVSNPNKLFYTIELKKTIETDLVLKTIRKLRKDKKSVLARISR